MLGAAVYVAGDYGLPLMFGTPIVMGLATAIVNHEPKQRTTSVIGNSFLAVGIAFGLLFMLAVEGAICILMAAPIAFALAAIGAIIGKAIVESSYHPRRQMGLAILALPIWLGVDALEREQPVYAVTTSIEIAAPIERVWASVIEFPDLPGPDEWYFRAGIACPTGARIDGAGVGAVRRCVFTTGTFVEPITVWDAPTRLVFDVTEQPNPMFELSPYHSIHPPHLDGTLRSLRGEFRLQRLAAGRTRLIGTTWYRLDMRPHHYWLLWSDWLIQAIHRRVLRHVKRTAES